MHLIYPCLPCRSRIAGPMWAAEHEWARARGLYLGWVLTTSEYDRLAQLLPLAVSPAEYLLVQGQAFGANDAGGAVLPQSLKVALAALQPRLFYSFDVAETLASEPVLVEVGDGQVSAPKAWSVAELGSQVLRALAKPLATP